MGVDSADIQQEAGGFEERLDSLFLTVDQLPTLPEILWEIQAQLQDSRSAAIDVAFAIENDPSITTNVLRLANSAFYGFSERFVSIEDAVIMIGRREIERMVSATLLIDSFGDASGTMDYAGFWAHSLRVADAAEFISEIHYTVSPYAPSEAYLGGLMHDCGKLILNQFLPDDWAKAETYAKVHDCTDCEAERATIGTDHGEIAARLLELWASAPNLIEGTRYHHCISQSSPDFTANAELIAFADSLAHAYENDELPEEEIPHALYGLNASKAALLAGALEGASKKAELLLS